MSADQIIEITPHDGLLHIVVQKRSLTAATTETLTDSILGAAAQHPHLPIVLDLGTVTFAPSVALGALVQMSKSFSIDGRRIALVGVHPRVMEAIKVTRLDTVLEIHDTIDDIPRTK